MIDWFNSLAIYSLKFVNNGNYIGAFVLIFAILGFFFTVIALSIDEEDNHTFFETISGAFVISIVFAVIGLILSCTWSLILFLLYILPILILSFGIYKFKSIKNWFINSKINKKKKYIIKNVVNNIKCEELAKQAYENLKKDFPNISYQSVLESIKNKM